MASKTINRPPALKTRAAEAATRNAQRRLEGLATLESLDCLGDVPTNELVRLLDYCVFRAFAAGNVIFSEYIQGEFLHLLLQGHVRLTLHDKDGHEVLLGVLGRGDCYGEGPLFGDLFRRAGVRAETHCYVLQLRLADLRTLLPIAPALGAALRRVYRRRLIESTLARVPLFSRLSPMERTLLADMLQPHHHHRGNTIMREGEPGDALYIIESGQVAVEQGDQAIASLDEGDFFGEISLLSEQPHNASVRALTPTDVLVLPAADFHRLRARRPDLDAQLRHLVEQRLASGAALRSDQHRARQMMLAVGHGLLRGSYLLARTPELCPPGCRICESSCATRHGNTRLHLNGVAIGSFDVVDACRQCRVGAECVEACPEDAFEWSERGVLVITDRCTGCGACVSACPYDAVVSVPAARHDEGGPLWRLWRAMRQRARWLHNSIPLEPARPAHRADKCDLCHGYEDMACIASCPTGSLRLVPVEELLPL